VGHVGCNGQICIFCGDPSTHLLISERCANAVTAVFGVTGH